MPAYVAMPNIGCTYSVSQIYIKGYGEILVLFNARSLLFLAILDATDFAIIRMNISSNKKHTRSWLQRLPNIPNK